VRRFCQGSDDARARKGDQTVTAEAEQRLGDYAQGLQDEQDAIVKWLRETGRYDNPWNLADVADAVLYDRVAKGERVAPVATLAAAE
jgi:hypothetical protein